LKPILTLLILVAFIAQTFNQASIVARYYVNTAAFAKNCENKAKPQMHCNGKCQMMKQLQKASKNDQQAPEKSGNAKNEALSSKSFFASIKFSRLSSPIHFNKYQVQKLPSIPTVIFHPPWAA
jgi:hypothetical protein